MAKNVEEIHNKARQNMWDQSIDNHKLYIDETTGLFKKEFVEKRSCPACNRDHCINIFSKEGGQYVSCLSCRMVYLNPVFTDAALTAYYTNNKVEQGLVVSDDFTFYEELYNKGLTAAQGRTSVSNILDIGCSTGLFLDIAKSNGWKTYGLELNQIESEISGNKGHKVEKDLLENANFDVKFGIISFWDVFEHIKDGAKTLRLAKELLTDDGVILIQIPSSDSIAAKVMQGKCNMFDGLEHVNLYGVNSLKLLVENCKLNILDIKSVIPELGVLNNYLNYEDPYTSAGDNFKSVFTLVSDEEVLQSLLGYKLQVVLG